MRTFTLYSSAAAPMLLIGGWLVAESRQPAAFDPMRDAISDLAAIGATDRAIMTVALAGTGLAHLVTAYGLTDAARPGRLLIALGGLATILVAAFPLPEQGSSAAHTTVATIAFLALAAWPLIARPRAASRTPSAQAGSPAPSAQAGSRTPSARAGSPAPSARSAGRADAHRLPGETVAPTAETGDANGMPAVLRPPVSIVAGVVLLGLVGWFGVTLQGGGALGLAERAAAAAQAIWPFIVAFSIRVR
ncbi:DUF998 domain-containing protein [Catenuloplanes japonicus]|uniref:DUF998 domain-containing protein n=1 Tax=Catenuloplanes japonicus TaxID=33876 RepID=UPI00068AB239|nr:DUF998 domain-containing protein [Catenuloplanes japonicus]